MVNEAKQQMFKLENGESENKIEVAVQITNLKNLKKN